MERHLTVCAGLSDFISLLLFPELQTHLLPIQLVPAQKEILLIATVEHNLKDAGAFRLESKARSIKAGDDSALGAAGGRP